MKICLVNAVVGRSLDTAPKLRAKYWHIDRMAEALADRGHAVHVVQATPGPCEIAGRNYTAIAIEASRPSRHGNNRMLEIDDYTLLEARLDGIQPDVIHLFGLTLQQPMRGLARWLHRNRGVLSASYHGGRPGRSPVARWRQRRVLRELSIAMFPAQDSLDRWRATRMLDTRTRTIIAPEVASPFQGMSRDEGRKVFPVDGAPLVAWCGRLHPIKDPLTTLRAMRVVFESIPDARLLMVYQDAPLLEAVKDFVRSHELLHDRVHLLGEIPHERVEALLSAADVFVQSSVREFGSNTLVEAMACGAIPVVTDLPSLRQLTNSIGPARHFPVGDARAMAGEIIAAAGGDIDADRERVRNSCRQVLSYEALAETWEQGFTHAGAGA